MRVSSVLAVIVALLLALAVSYGLSYRAYSSLPSRSNATAVPLSSFSVSPSRFSGYYDHGILSFISESASDISISPSNSTSSPSLLPSSSSPSSYFSNITFSLYWGYLFRWNFSVSPGYVNGSRLYLCVVPASNLPSENASLLYGGKRLSANLSGSLTLLFSSTPSSTSVLLDGNETLLTLKAPLSPSPQINVSADRGALVLLHVNYVTLSYAKSFQEQRASTARSSFLYSFIPSLAVFEAVAVERKRAYLVSRSALLFAERRLLLPLSVLFLASGGAASYFLLKGLSTPANDAALVAYFSLVAAVALELHSVYRSERKGEQKVEEGATRNNSPKRRVVQNAIESSEWWPTKREVPKKHRGA